MLLCEVADLSQRLPSASSKLAYGGLRYLEQLQFRMVREALEEREILLRTAPHIVRPLRFILAHVPGGRPHWMFHAGLALYDRLGRRRALPRSRRFAITSALWRRILKPRLTSGFAYSDCSVDDACLGRLNALDAHRRSAEILTRTRCDRLARIDGMWQADLVPTIGKPILVAARAVVNTAGPWADRVRRDTAGLADGPHLRLVKGSHIVVPVLYENDHAFILQNDDGRVIFVIPYYEKFSLIGTTDMPVDDVAACQTDSAAEISYLCRVLGNNFCRAPKPCDVAWYFAGVRALYDDGNANPSAVTRDYVLDLDRQDGAAPLLSVFGRKITTARCLAEHALARLRPHLPIRGGPWTEHVSLPGGGAPPGSVLPDLAARHKGIDQPYLDALVGRHGTIAVEMLADVKRARSRPRFRRRAP